MTTHQSFAQQVPTWSNCRISQKFKKISSKWHHKLTCMLQTTVPKISIGFVLLLSTIYFLLKSIIASNNYSFLKFLHAGSSLHTPTSIDHSKSFCYPFIFLCLFVCKPPRDPVLPLGKSMGCYLIYREPSWELKYRHRLFCKSICSPLWPRTNPEHQSGQKKKKREITHNLYPPKEIHYLKQSWNKLRVIWSSKSKNSNQKGLKNHRLTTFSLEY